MLVVNLKKLPENIVLPVNLEAVCFIMPYKEKSATEIDLKSCILSMNNGATLHVAETMAKISGMMNNARK